VALLQLRDEKLGFQLAVADILAGLRAGEPVAFPTEFGYLFGCDATNPYAIKRLKEARNDVSESGYAILFKDFDQLAKFAGPISNSLKEILLAHWDGLLTLEIGKKDRQWNVGDNSHSQTFYARSTRSEFLREILGSYGPLAISSASVKGWPSLETAEQIQENFSKTIHTVVGDGNISQAKSTTVITQVEEDISILREGSIATEVLQEQFPNIHFQLLADR
jgi:L-threonylcarbamoyladenylate synthase